MNFSTLKADALAYLSPKQIPLDAQTEQALQECFSYLLAHDSFRFVSAEYDAPLDFLRAEPYASFLEGAQGYYLIAGTLGIEIDRHLRALSLTDLAKALLFDACANAYLEAKMQEEKALLHPQLSYTFCPGYAGSDLHDLSIIFDALKLEKMGMELTSSYLMLPQKSIVGIVAKDVTPAMRCGDCAKKSNCTFRKEGRTCFQSEQN